MRYGPANPAIVLDAESHTGSGEAVFDTSGALSVYVRTSITAKHANDTMVLLGVLTSVDGVEWMVGLTDPPGSSAGDPLPAGGISGGVSIGCPGPFTKLVWDIIESAAPTTATIGAVVSFGLPSEQSGIPPVG